MAEILPFIGTRYNSQLIGNLGKVLSPPYDVVSPEQQEELYARHEYNVIHLELNREQPGDDQFSNKYTRAANTLKTWRSDGILIEEEKPAVYLYEQEFRLPCGEVKKRRGFYCLVKLDDACAAQPRPVEEALVCSRNDRLNLLRTTHANLSPIFAVYNDPENVVMDLISQKMLEKPWEEITDDDGITHRLWVCQKKEFFVALQEVMKSRQLHIADGYNRFETALCFRNEMRKETGKANGKQPYDYMMMYLTNAEQDGLVILPTHRALTRSFMKEVNFAEALEELEEKFELREAQVDLTDPSNEAKRIVEELGEAGQDLPAFAMVLGNGKVYYLKLREDADPLEMIDEELADSVKRLDVSILHYYIINYVMIGNPEFELEDDECYFIRDAKRVLELLQQKKVALAFLLNPTKLEQVIEIISAGERMPRKSTYFHPKIISGFVIRNMDCEAKKAQPAGKKPVIRA